MYKSLKLIKDKMLTDTVMF